MSDIATNLGLHSSTVSLALRNDRRISEPTRKKVWTEAKRINYRANPLVSALMSHRARHSPPPFHMELAFVCATNSKTEWLEQSEAYHRMLNGATERATDLGYGLTLYPRESSRINARRFSDILAARNVHGILIAPMHRSDVRMDIDWDRFSVIELGYTLRKPTFHRIVHDYFHSMLLALKEIRKRGFKRIGLVLRQIGDEKVHHLWRAAYIDVRESIQPRNRLKPLIRPDISVPVFEEWLRREKPEVLVCIDFKGIMKLLKSLRIEVPNDLSVVSLGCYTPADPMAGIYQDYELMGASAINQLISMVNRNEKGIPQRNLSTQVGGVWHDGPTLGNKGVVSVTVPQTFPQNAKE